MAAAPSSPAAVAHADEAGLVRRLGALHPGDVGIVVTLLLQPLTVPEPGQAVYAPAGRLHAYLGGLGVEVMANSDNVVRAGLTTKQIDRAELRRPARRGPRAGATAAPVLGAAEGEASFPTPAPEFLLSRFEGDPSPPRSPAAARDPVVHGRHGVRHPARGRPGGAGAGASVFVAAVLDSYRLGGPGTVFRAQVPGW